jgi:pilus assembly protein TadC
MPIRTAGRAVAGAFDGPVGDDLDRALALAELGSSDAEAWLSLRDHPQLGAAAQELARSAESGTMMVEGLRHHAEAAREARRAALLVRARGVGVRSVLPLMTCFIPSFLLLGVVPTVVSTLAGVLG